MVIWGNCRLPISVSEFFDRFAELFKNLNIPVITHRQLAAQVRQFERSRRANRLAHNLRSPSVDRDSC
jgi:uncharacterized protein YigA (DUF484 family)